MEVRQVGRPVPIAVAVALLTLWPTPAFPQQADRMPPSRSEGNGQRVEREITDSRPAEFDLDAYVAGLNPPTVEEIIASLEPIPTRRALLEMVRQPPPEPPQLSDADADRVAKLDEEIQSLREGGEYAEAVQRAAEIVRIRRQAGQPDQWWEVVSARRLLHDLRHISELSASARDALSRTDAANTRRDELARAGEYDEFLQLCAEQLAARHRWLPSNHPDLASSLSDVGHALMSLGAPDLAERLFRQAVATSQRVYPGGHQDTALLLNNLAYALAVQRAPASAEPVARAALALHRQLGFGDDANVAIELNLLGDILVDLGDPAGAEPWYREALAMRERVFATDHKDVACSLNNVAFIASKLDNFAEAERLYREALAMRRRLFPGDHVAVAITLSNLADVLRERNDLAEAENAAREALAMFQRLYPDDDEAKATSLNNLGGILKAREDLPGAEALYREALEMRQRLFPTDHAHVAHSLNNLAYVLKDRGDLAAAEALFRQALAMIERLYPTGHLQVAAARNNLGDILSDRGNLGEAETRFREALRTYQELFPGDHSSIARSLNNLAWALKVQGDYVGAETLFREVLAMYQRLFPGDNERVAMALNNLGWVLGSRGDWAGAETLHREALDMYQRLFPGDHRHVARGLMNLAIDMKAHGELGGAEALHRQALDMWQRLIPGDHPDVAASKSLLGTVLGARGDLTAAESLVREALEMRQRLFPGDHPDVASSLDGLGDLLYLRSDLDAAESLLREALEMYQRIFPGDHPNIVSTLRSLATVRLEREDLAGAEDYFQRAFDMAERLRTHILGAERERATFAGRLRLAQIGTALASVMLQRERAADAFSVLERSRSRALLDLLDRSERDVIEEAMRATGAGAADELAVALAAEQELVIELTTAEALLGGRRKDRKALERRDGQSADKKTRRLAQYDQQIAELEDKVKELRQAESDARARILALVRKLYPDAKPMSAAQVLAGLEPHELLLYYAWGADAVCVLVAGGADSGTRGGRDAAAPRFVRGRLLANGEEAVEELAALATKVRGLLANRPSAQGDEEPEDTSRELFIRLVPEEVRTQILAANRVIVVPDGPLQLIPIEALASSDDATERRSDKRNWLLDAGPEFVYAPSATVYLNRRQQRLARDRKGGPAAGGAPSLVALGDPLFERERPSTPQYPEHGVVITMVVDGSNAAHAGLRRGDVVLSYDGQNVADYQELVAALGHVKEQVAAGQRSADERIAVTYWSGGDTNETTLAPGRMGVRLDRARPPEVLEYLVMRSRGEAEKVAGVSALDQIRLHGGTLTPLPGTRREASVIADLIQAAGGSVSELLCCEDATIGRLESAVEGKRYVHLATHGLTGSRGRPYDVSLALTQPVTVTPDDIGFLTLDRIIRRWRGKLRDCDLIVLSACDTQRGVKAGDSMMALPWGFMYAGAPTVVASLWKVDDTATALLMIRFYENLLGSVDSRTAAYRAEQPATSKAAALRQAKLWLRELTDEQVRALCETYKLPPPRFKARGETGPMGISGQPGPPFKHPYYWASFILIGNPN